MTTLHGGSMNSNGVGGGGPGGGLMGHRLSTTYLPPTSVVKQFSTNVENANTFI